MSSPPTKSPYFAAIDLGSNSFHMLIVKANDGVLETVDRIKEMVQIARGFKKNYQLTEKAQARALSCLSCFHERVQHIPPEQIRAVGTKALRSAKNADSFLQQAEVALGHSIEIISGYEEARLVYLGVGHEISADKGKPLIIDIGGGSTEFIIGQGKKPDLMESLSIGCVTYSDKFFPHNSRGAPLERINAQQINEAYYATCVELELITRRYRHQGWDITVGSSGSMKAIAELMPSEVVAGIVTKAGLGKILSELRDNGCLSNTKNISAQRLSVLPAAIVILSAIFDQLGLDEIHVVGATLKEGLIYDTLGRLLAKDMRDKTVKKFIKRYQIDQKQASRVANTLQHFLKNVSYSMINGVDVRKILNWSALLHEMGLSVSHARYHHHGSYLLKHSDMAGFSRFEQTLLALFVGAHRRKIPANLLALFNADARKNLAIYIVCLRIAVLLNHRRENTIEFPKLITQEGTITVEFADGWLDKHPLTYRNLLQEQRDLMPLNIQLELY